MYNIDLKVCTYIVFRSGSMVQFEFNVPDNELFSKDLNNTILVLDLVVELLTSNSRSSVC